MKGIKEEDLRAIMPTMLPELAIEVCLMNFAANKENSLDDKVLDGPIDGLTFRHVITALNGAQKQITGLQQFLNDIFEAGVESGLIRETEVIPDAGEES